MSIFNKQKTSLVINLLLEISLYIFPATLLFRWSHVNAICVCILVLYSASLLAGRRLPRFVSPLSLPVFLFLLAVFISSTMTIGLAGTWREGKHVLYGIGIFFILLDQISRKPGILKRSLFSLMILTVFLSLDSFLQWFTGKDIIGMELFSGRCTSVFTNPNYLCFFISGTIPIPVFLMHETKNAWIKTFCIVVLLSSYVTIVFAGVRSGLLALLIFFIFYLVRKEGKVIWPLLGLSLWSILLYFYDPIGIKGRFAEIFDHGDVRLAIWKQTLVLIRQDPLWGKGLDTFKDLYPTVRVDEIFYSSPHNFFLEIWQTSGILALLLFLYIIYKTVVLNVKHIRQERVCAYLFISTVMLFLTSAVSIPFFSKYVSFYFWFYFGLLIGAMKIQVTNCGEIGVRHQFEISRELVSKFPGIIEEK